MLFGFFGLGPQEISILVLIGGFLLAQAVIGGILLLLFLRRRDGV